MLSKEIYMIIGGVLTAIFLRCATSLHSYSGQNTPPMFGDYEAQRHWMEITFNLPIRQWYLNSTQNDLMYWGLDYPPLTAYHSWLCGLIAHHINPQYVELNTSRGFESSHHKLFMRYTVLIADLLIYIPALCIYFFLNYTPTSKPIQTDVKKRKSNRKSSQNIIHSFLFAIFYPGIILIDHGHFQYNCVSLGLTIMAVNCITMKKYKMAGFLFTCALNYKQMELYHALPFFCFYLNLYLFNSNSILYRFYKIFEIGVIVFGTFLLIWLPFVFDVNLILQVLRRLFPFARGVFEDKVANFWCTLNIFIKLKTLFANQEMAKICLVTTLISIIPTTTDLLFRGHLNKDKFLLSLINCSLGFYLFSFQVHEKTILIVAISVLLYFHKDPFTCYWFLYMTCFSMVPLFIKDGLCVAYMSLIFFYLFLYRLLTKRSNNVIKNKYKYGRNQFIRELLITLLNVTDGDKDYTDIVTLSFRHLVRNIQLVKQFIIKSTFVLSYFISIILFIIISIFDPPDELPDLFTVIISIFSFGHFFLFFIYFNYCQFTLDVNSFTSGKSSNKQLEDNVVINNNNYKNVKLKQL
ncbi:probable dolichyl pyrophosphate Man9GlcNAc2 alpha-1,3-glucosyltransferase [Chrysoperla carnea]|uniref:probable dolichyl pyrophosphate Man9GlcNAc2 alpha-1,3-glucosyltransferase n=1 Tax=Chrysoperla carnea TaxID=189513 RepID=UPI001D0954EC|nr:probable dolichyl pyrophosphate Man9GlcNAc2 alpha-1,3-glucosyltransferase [Chrysoperla carnea]